MIFERITKQLQSLKQLINELTDEQYTLENELLGKVSIGSHSRHIIELMQCVLNGYNKGEVDYENRKRDLSLQTNRSKAIASIDNLEKQMFLPDKELELLLMEENEQNRILEPIKTTYLRELIYNLEHTIHHLALINVALRSMKLSIVSENFGMAYSTIAYKKSLETVK
jgi:hypothetical protein